MTNPLDSFEEQQSCKHTQIQTLTHTETQTSVLNEVINKNKGGFWVPMRRKKTGNTGERKQFMRGERKKERKQKRAEEGKTIYMKYIYIL